MIGKTILNYKVKSLIGEGGMGTVYLGEHTSIDRKVAIKVLRAELANNVDILARFKNEASIMAHLQHLGIVAMYDYVEKEGQFYLIMEYVEGKELKELLHRLKEPMSFERAKDLMKKMLSAFAVAHEKGIVHRDVKPSNIIISDKDEVKVLDFGIAKLLGNDRSKLTKTGTQVGTIYYMSPEQVRAKELDYRSDIYSLGIIFYELLAGFCPYTSLTSEYEIYAKIVQEPLLPLTDTMGAAYKDVWNIIQKATQKDPKDRFQNCQEFIEAIDGKVLEVKEVPLQSNSPKEAPIVEPKKKSNAWIYVVLSVAVVGAIVVFFVNSSSYWSSTDDQIGVPVMPSEYEQPHTGNRVLSKMESYYASLEGDGNNFNAHEFYAPDVSQFIHYEDVTPDEINGIHFGKDDYYDPKVLIQRSTIRDVGVRGDDSYWQYWANFRCYRTKKQAVQTCQIQIEVGFDTDGKMVSYEELDVIDLKFNYGIYIKASARRLSDFDVGGMYKDELRIMRNEIFARYGRIFQTEAMKTYFNDQFWYVPKYANVDRFLTQLEKDNIELIQSYE